MTKKFTGIKIQTDVPELPIEIGKLTYTFGLSDDNITNFRKKSEEVKAKLDGMEIDEEGDLIEQVKGVLEIGFDNILGEGAFKDVYKQTPSVTYLSNYFAQLVIGVTEAIDGMDNGSADMQKMVDRYTRRKK